MLNRKALFAIPVSALFAGAAFAGNEVEGAVESVDQEEQSFVVEGIQMKSDDATEYENGYDSFEDLEEGEDVDVEFEYRDGEHFATGVDKKD